MLISTCNRSSHTRNGMRVDNSSCLLFVQHVLFIFSGVVARQNCCRKMDGFGSLKFHNPFLVVATLVIPDRRTLLQQIKESKFAIFFLGSKTFFLAAPLKKVDIYRRRREKNGITSYLFSEFIAIRERKDSFLEYFNIIIIMVRAEFIQSCIGCMFQHQPRFARFEHPHPHPRNINT